MDIIAPGNSTDNGPGQNIAIDQKTESVETTLPFIGSIKSYLPNNIISPERKINNLLWGVESIFELIIVIILPCPEQVYLFNIFFYGCFRFNFFHGRINAIGSHCCQEQIDPKGDMFSNYDKIEVGSNKKKASEH